MVQCCARVIQKCNQKSSSRSCLQTMWDSYYCYLESLIFLYIRFRVYGTSHKGAQGFVLHCHSWDFRLFSVSMYLGLNESISTGNLIFIRLISQVLFNLTFHHFHLPSLWRSISLFLQLPETLHPTADRGCGNQESSSRKSDQSCWLAMLRSYGKGECLLQLQVLTSFPKARPMPSNVLYNFKILDLNDDNFIESKNTPHHAPRCPQCPQISGIRQWF